MSTENTSTNDEIPTVDLTADAGQSADSPPVEAAEQTTEDTSVAPAETDDDAPVENSVPHGLHSNEDADDEGFDWVGEGQHISVERPSETETEILIVSNVEETTGLAVMALNPAELRELHLQLGSVIETQNYESWVAYGNDPNDYQSAVEEDYDEEAEESEDEEEETGRGRWSKVKDPANVGSMVSALDSESPVKGMSWKVIIALAFIFLTIVLVIISGLT